MFLGRSGLARRPIHAYTKVRVRPVAQYAETRAHRHRNERVANTVANGGKKTPPAISGQGAISYAEGADGESRTHDLPLTRRLLCH